MKKRIRTVTQIKITMAFIILIIGCQIVSNPINADMVRVNDNLFDEEFDSGVIFGEGMNMSYAWVQTSETALLSLATYDDVYKVAPFHPFFGQRIQLEDNEYFVGNIIAGFELYEDLNGNHILDSQVKGNERFHVHGHFAGILQEVIGFPSRVGMCTYRELESSEISRSKFLNITVIPVDG